MFLQKPNRTLLSLSIIFLVTIL